MPRQIMLRVRPRSTWRRLTRWGCTGITHPWSHSVHALARPLRMWTTGRPALGRAAVCSTRPAAVPIYHDVAARHAGEHDGRRHRAGSAAARTRPVGEHRAGADRVRSGISASATGDLVDGPAGLHFARAVAYMSGGDDPRALAGAELMLAAAEREDERRLALLRAVRCAPHLRLELGEHGRRRARPRDRAARPGATPSTRCVRGVDDPWLASNAHTGIALPYHGLRLYELAAAALHRRVRGEPARAERDRRARDVAAQPRLSSSSTGRWSCTASARPRRPRSTAGRRRRTPCGQCRRLRPGRRSLADCSASS